jgi:hypothetical protein
LEDELQTLSDVRDIEVKIREKQRIEIDKAINEGR